MHPLPFVDPLDEETTIGPAINLCEPCGKSITQGRPESLSTEKIEEISPAEDEATRSTPVQYLKVLPVSYLKDHDKSLR